jgi:membrane protease YdiL (CAAX protease family)
LAWLFWPAAKLAAKDIQEFYPLPVFASSSSVRPSRALQFALFVTACAWWLAMEVIAGRAARGIALRFELLSEESLLSAIFLLFLLAIGFSILQKITGNPASWRDVLGLPKRATAKNEWAIGATIGWGIVLVAVLPMALAGSMHVHFWTQPRAFWLLAVNLATMLVTALVEEVSFRGYPFQRLIEAIGPVGATLAISVFFGLLHAFNPDATLISVMITVLAGVLLSVAWLRTHGLWLGWGLHFAWNASMGLLFGLPVSGVTRFSAVVETRAIGPMWLTGGAYGPEGSLVAVVAIVIGLVVLVRMTRDYAWDYTRSPIIAAGYPVDVAPPAAHTAMEQEAPKPAALVQILPTTPQTRSVSDLPE